MTDTLYWGLLKYVLFQLVRKIFGFIQGMVWLINGTYLRIYHNSQHHNFDVSAHVQTIYFRYKFDHVLGPAVASDFIACHHSFQNPKYVLQDHVTLYYITRTEAIFVETDPDVDVLNSDVNSFMGVAQYLKARKIIRLPISVFHELVQSIPKFNGKLIFVSHTSRCGSTLLCQIFEQTNRMRCLSEPHALNAIGLYEGRIPQDELDRLVVNSVRMLCKPIKRPISGYVLKTMAPTINAAPMFIRLFPDASHMFMYRDGLPVAQSLCRSMTQMPLLQVALVLMRYSESLTRRCADFIGFSSSTFPVPPAYYSVKQLDWLECSVYLWASYVATYRDFQQARMRIAAVKYEHIVADPLSATETVFEYCGVPREWAEGAIKALQKDSQRNSPLSTNKLRRFERALLNAKSRENTDTICDYFALPRLPSTCVLEGTITDFDCQNVHENGK